MEYRHLIADPSTKQTWEHSFANELGRLAQGFQNVHGNDTIHFIPFNTITAHKRKHITYGSLVVDLKPHKAEQHRTHLTVGGDRLQYDDKVFTKTADITTVKILLNSTRHK